MRQREVFEALGWVVLAIFILVAGMQSQSAQAAPPDRYTGQSVSALYTYQDYEEEALKRNQLGQEAMAVPIPDGIYSEGHIIGHADHKLWWVGVLFSPVILCLGYATYREGF